LVGGLLEAQSDLSLRRETGPRRNADASTPTSAAFCALLCR
jgi:hypothetical protein